MAHVTLSDQCKMRYYERVSLCNEMQDTPILRTSPIQGNGRRAYFERVLY
jgi:hypothetical protein